MRLPWPLYLLVALFLGFGFWCASSTPYRQPGQLKYQRDPATGQGQRVVDIGAPDERQHANYIKGLLDKKGFPVLDPKDPNLEENYQSHQPPLYYLVAAGWSMVSGADPTMPSDGIKVRFLNLLIGAGTMVGVYFLILWGRSREDEALAGAAFCMMPMFVALHAAVTNDPLLFCLITWSLALAMRAMKEGWTLPRAVWVGVLAGLALLTKTSAIILVPALLSIPLAAWIKDKARPAWPSFIPSLIGIVVVSPWWMRNASLYGDPLGQKVFTVAFQGSPQAQAFIDGLGASTYWLNMVLWWTARSFIGAFGYMDIFLFETMGSEKSASIYLALLFLIGVALAAGAMRWIRREEADEDSVSVFPVAMAVLLLAAAAVFVQFNRQFFQGQARYLYPAIGAFASLWGAGWGWLRARGTDLPWIGATLLLALLNFLAMSQLPAAFALRTGP